MTMVVSKWIKYLTNESLANGRVSLAHLFIIEFCEAVVQSVVLLTCCHFLVRLGVQQVVYNSPLATSISD